MAAVAGHKRLPQRELVLFPRGNRVGHQSRSFPVLPPPVPAICFPGGERQPASVLLTLRREAMPLVGREDLTAEREEYGVADLSENIASAGGRRCGRYRLGGYRRGILPQRTAALQAQELSHLVAGRSLVNETDRRGRRGSRFLAAARPTLTSHGPCFVDGSGVAGILGGDWWRSVVTKRFRRERSSGLLQSLK